MKEYKLRQDIRQGALDLIIDTIVAYEERLKKISPELTNKDTYLLKEMSGMLSDHYINGPCSDFDRYAFNVYKTRADTLVENEKKRLESIERALKP